MTGKIDKKELKSKEGFAKLYETYYDRAIRTAKLITRSDHMAADVVQETFIRVYRSLDTYKEEQAFSKWFNTILINECKRELTKSSKVSYIAEYQEEANKEEDISEKWETQDAIKEALDALDESLKVPMVLRYIQDLKIQDIADIINVNINTVKYRLTAAKEKMRENYLRFNKEV